MRKIEVTMLGGLLSVIFGIGAGCAEEDVEDDAAGDKGDISIDESEDAPLPDSKQGVWTWVPVDGTFCRDGSQAGLSVRYGNFRDKIVIFAQGGGACFNFATCLVNLANIPEVLRVPESVGILDFDNADNPVADYSAVFIPFCTGDVHTGAEIEGEIDNIEGRQMFVGGNNFERFLRRIVPTFPEASKVVVAGISAGGFGALFNYWKVIESFGDGVSVVAIDDAGPLMRAPYFSACLQALIRASWDIDAHLPDDCDQCFADDAPGLHALVGYIADRYPNASLGLISSTEDATIRSFWGYGMNDCEVNIPVYDRALYTEGLEDLRDYYEKIAFGGTFYYPGDDHAKLLSSDFYSLSVGDATLLGWVEDIIDGTMSHVGPNPDH